MGTKSGWDRREESAKGEMGQGWSGLVQRAQGEIPKAASVQLKANFKGLGRRKKRPTKGTE